MFIYMYGFLDFFLLAVLLGTLEVGVLANLFLCGFNDKL